MFLLHVSFETICKEKLPLLNCLTALRDRFFKKGKMHAHSSFLFAGSQSNELVPSSDPFLNANWYNHCGEQDEESLKTKKTELSCGPAVSLQGIYLEKNHNPKRHIQPVPTAALFTGARAWKQPACPSREGWVKQMWYIHTTEYHSATKERNNAICNNTDGPRDCHTK